VRTAEVLSPEVERVLLSPPKLMPKVEHLDPFLEAARQVLEQELATAVNRGKLTLANGAHTTQDVTAIIGITGQLARVFLHEQNQPWQEVADAAVSLVLDGILADARTPVGR